MLKAAIKRDFQKLECWTKVLESTFQGTVAVLETLKNVFN